MAEVGSHLCKLPGPAPLLRAGSNREGFLGPGSGFGYLQGWRHHRPPGKHFPVFAREIKHKRKNAKPFLRFKWILQYVDTHLSMSVSCPVTEKSLA